MESTALLSQPQLDIGGVLRHGSDIGAMPRAHRHQELEMNLVTAGSATYLLRGRRYELHRNTLVWLFPDQDHCLIEKSQRFDYWIGLFTRPLLTAICTTPATAPLIERDPAGRMYRLLDKAGAARLEAVFVAVSRAVDAAARRAGLAFATLAAWEEFATGGEVEDRALHPAVVRTVQFLRDETDAIGLDRLAAQVGLSAPYLSELFKSQIGTTVSQFRNRQRLQRFLDGEARAPSRRTLLEAALDAGFGSYPQFYRIFLELTGISPGEYRRSRS